MRLFSGICATLSFALTVYFYSEGSNITAFLWSISACMWTKNYLREVVREAR